RRGDFGAQYLACVYPWEMRRPRPCACSRMTRGQDGALLLSCAALSSATPYLLIPALSLITRSALASIFGGIVRPICLAGLRLIVSSDFFDCSTGRSAGLVPLRILST